MPSLNSAEELSTGVMSVHKSQQDLQSRHVYFDADPLEEHQEHLDLDSRWFCCMGMDL